MSIQNKTRGFPSGLQTLSVTLRGPPLDSEMDWTGEIWSNRVLLILENKEGCIYLFLFLSKKNHFFVVEKKCFF